MFEINAFVAENTAYFIDLVKTADDQPLQMQFQGDTQIKIPVQGIMMGDKGTGGSAAGFRLEAPESLLPEIPVYSRNHG